MQYLTMCFLEIILTNLATIDYCDMKFGTDVFMCGKVHKRVLKTNIHFHQKIISRWNCSVKLLLN